MQKIKDFIKEEFVLCIATLLAVISMFLVYPDREYMGYIDFRTLGILFSLMVVMEGWKSLGVFEKMAQGLLMRVQNMWQLTFILTMLCFFFSMFITNDVALITFVPLTLIVLNMLGEELKGRFVVVIVVLQTIAANLGSMLTPIGNPQNLYLYGKANMSLAEFFILMLPYTAVSFLLLVLGIFFVCRKEKKRLTVLFSNEVQVREKGQSFIYLGLFILCLLTVARILPVWAVVFLVLIVALCMERKVLRRVDYRLLLTFVALFIFIGNMGRMESFRGFLVRILQGNELLTSIISSQVISNVPAALLLSGFSDKYRELIVGVNLGGLGTLIASMASLISFKYVAKDKKELRGKYMLYFTVGNLVFLLLLLLLAYLMR